MARITVDWPTFWGAISFLVIGGGFAIFGGYQLATTYAFTRNATQYEATIVENAKTCDDDGSCTWWPRVQFAAPPDGLQQAKTRFGASNYGWGKGTKIKILSNPAYPYVRIPGFDNLYLLGAAFFALGMLPVILSFWLLARFTFRVRQQGNR
ncbi:DUF3592 domain-containing protein [Aquicoccus sp. G2-2]|uniref:DUF3592 domain-containing protein n=1 Tax=Aquicoccus sp. G2-2 TaxID=3092120 RepID=UPI002AE037E4|nr:DUF3592 domain-containing protein [Aquicoccus sp. G2-2]MEA1114336.1 hypothetical protein [Aquicoccus sp. G2-2]